MINFINVCANSEFMKKFQFFLWATSPTSVNSFLCLFGKNADIVSNAILPKYLKEFNKNIK